jgi:hypothetical protein
MKNQKLIYFRTRVPGKKLIDTLRQVISMPHNKQWMVDVDEKTNQVSILCYRCSGSKVKVVPKVQMKIVGPVVPDHAYTSVTFELDVEGLRNIFAEGKFLDDFESIKREVSEVLKRYQVRPFRAFFEQPDAHDLPGMPLASS